MEVAPSTVNINNLIYTWLKWLLKKKGNKIVKCKMKTLNWRQIKRDGYKYLYFFRSTQVKENVVGHLTFVKLKNRIDPIGFLMLYYLLLFSFRIYHIWSNVRPFHHFDGWKNHYICPRYYGSTIPFHPSKEIIGGLTGLEHDVNLEIFNSIYHITDY